jgi:hypothetical protein
MKDLIHADFDSGDHFRMHEKVELMPVLSAPDGKK